MEDNRLSAGLRARVAMEKYGFRPTHSLGQNFLLDDRLIAALVEASGAGEGDDVLEIGPGAGVMTCALAERCKKVLAVEVDRSLEGVLGDVLRPYENVKVLFQDFMRMDIKSLAGEEFSGGPFRVVANLPYYITTDVILRLLTSGVPVREIAVMVQKEAAERIMAHPGEKQWCATAAIVQYFGQPEVVLEVPPEAFDPAPHVVSCFMRIHIYEEKPVRPADEALFLRLVACAFAMRRKTLANNLKAGFSLSQEAARAALAEAGLDERVRGEALSLEELARLSDVLGQCVART